MSESTKWAIDQLHSDIHFRVRHLMISHVNGSFINFDASIYTTDKNFLTAQVDLWIDVDSVSTGDTTRDAHLKGPDFFDVQNHKQITFTSTNIERLALNNTHELWGDLTIRGITKVVKLHVKFGGVLNDPWGNEKAGFTVTGTINRSDWGLTWNTAIETGGLVVSDEVTINCDVELTNVSNKDLVMTIESVHEPLK